VITRVINNDKDKQMPRIEGVDLPRNKRSEIGLTYIHGIGRTTARKALLAAGVNPDRRVRDLTEEEITSLRDYIAQNLTVEGDLRREVQMNIKRLVEIGCYRGLRHRGVCRCGVNEPVPMPAPAKDRRRPLLVVDDGVVRRRSRTGC